MQIKTYHLASTFGLLMEVLQFPVAFLNQG